MPWIRTVSSKGEAAVLDDERLLKTAASMKRYPDSFAKSYVKAVSDEILRRQALGRLKEVA